MCFFFMCAIFLMNISIVVRFFHGRLKAFEIFWWVKISWMFFLVPKLPLDMHLYKSRFFPKNNNVALSNCWSLLVFKFHSSNIGTWRTPPTFDVQNCMNIDCSCITNASNLSNYNLIFSFITIINFDWINKIFSAVILV